MSKDSQTFEKRIKSYIDKNGNTTLHRAVKERNMILLFKSALADSALNQQNRDGYSALHYAVKHGDKEIIEAALQCGIDPLLKTKLGQTAKDIAIVNKRSDLVELINSYSPGLYHSILTKDKNKTIDLLKKWVSPANVIKALNSKADSKTFNNNFIEMQLDYYFNQNQFVHLIASDEYHQVCTSIDLIRIFVNTIHLLNGTTPLSLAIRNRNLEMVDLLLNIGADPRIRLTFGTPLTHYTWNINAPFTILIAILNKNNSTWHMRCPETGSTILFTLASDPKISSVHIHKILSVTQCLVLRDRDCNKNDFYEFCQQHNRQDLIEAMWESIADMMGSKAGKLKLINLATAIVGQTILSVPDFIFKRIFIDGQLQTILNDYNHFIKNVSTLETEARELLQAVKQGDLIKIKQHNKADFINKNGRTALHEAILLDEYETVQWLLTERPSLLSIPDTNDRYPYHYSYGVSDLYGKKYVHLLYDMKAVDDHRWLTDINNNLPNTVKINLYDDSKEYLVN